MEGVSNEESRPYPTEVIRVLHDIDMLQRIIDNAKLELKREVFWKKGLMQRISQQIQKTESEARGINDCFLGSREEDGDDL